MQFHFTRLQLSITEGAWNAGVRCQAHLLDNGQVIASVARNANSLAVTGSIDISVLGDLPTSGLGGAGRLEFENRELGRFQCEHPGATWNFFDMHGKGMARVSPLSLWQRIGSWRDLEMNSFSKCKYLFRESIEISLGGVVFRSPRFTITRDALLDAVEQKRFNQFLEADQQACVIAAICLVQTTFGPRFVT